jgi:rhodanese-related sulfurtransferase
MKELNRTDRLTIATLIITLILVIGFVTLKKPEIHFTRTAEETLSLIVSSEDFILPKEVKSISQQNNNRFFLVDVRSPIEYQKSHIGQAVNIPVHDLLGSDNLKVFSRLSREDVTVILYGKDQLEANGAWMILKQTGYDHIRIMPGGFDFYSKADLSLSQTGNKPIYMAEEPAYDFRAVLNDLGSAVPLDENKAPEPVKVIRREKKSTVEGGC